MPFDYQKMRELREQQGLTMAQAAEAAGLSRRSHWNDIEKGKKKAITVETLEGVAKALKISPCDLLTKNQPFTRWETNESGRHS